MYLKHLLLTENRQRKAKKGIQSLFNTDSNYVTECLAKKWGKNGTNSDEKKVV